MTQLTRFLGVATAAALTGAVAIGAPASAAGSWFGPSVDTALSNTFGPGPAPRPATTADFNGDGHADTVSVSDFTFGDLLVSPGLGNGRFGAATKIAGSGGTQGLDAGDVTGDGKADVVTATTTDVTVWKGDGTGGFTKGGTFPLTLGGQVEPLLVDVDGDGDLDVVAPTFTAIQVRLNNGGGSFASAPDTQVTGASVISAITVAHIDNGPTKDLFAVDGSSGTAYALAGNGNGTFRIAGQLYGTSVVPEDVAAIDLNKDGFDDVAVVGSFSFSLTTALTNGQGGFKQYTLGTYQYAGPGPTSAAVADFNEDGRKDLVISSLADPSKGTLTVLSGNGTTKMASQGTYTSKALPQNPILADYDEDGDTDIAVVAPGGISFLPNTTP